VVDYSSLAPEQFEPIEQPQTSLDLWALGICIAWLFRGQMPFGTKSAQLPNHRLKARILEDEPPFWVDELPHPYNVLVARCLDKDPDTRLQTIAEFKALWAAEQANHAQIAAEPSPQTQKAQKPVKSSRSKEIPWLLYLVLGILAAVLGYWLN
jgi:serine/threonine protein kinase